MAMPKKILIDNENLYSFISRYKTGTPLAALHREYIAQGEDYILSLPIFMKLIKERIANETRMETH